MKNMCKIISIHNVSKNINGKDVLNNIDLEIYKKGISVIPAHNGAGKSTLLKIIAGISRPDSGKITYPKKTLLKLVLIYHNKLSQFIMINILPMIFLNLLIAQDIHLDF